MKTCLVFAGDDEVARTTPTVSLVARYGGFDPVAQVQIATSRGPDY